VLEAGWDAVSIWCRLSTQWVADTFFNVVPGGLAPLIVPSRRWRGLDYPGVNAVLSRTALAEPDAVFAQIQTMERAALAVLNQSQS
jgi:hypothetical protein